MTHQELSLLASRCTPQVRSLCINSVFISVYLVPNLNDLFSDTLVLILLCTADKLLSLSLVSFDLTDMRLTPATPTPPILKRQPIWPPAPLPRLLTSPPPLITPRPPEESFSHAPVDAKAAAQMEPAGEELRALEEEMILSVRDNEDTAVHISSVVDDPEAAWVTVVMANTSPSVRTKQLHHL